MWICRSNKMNQKNSLFRRKEKSKLLWAKVVKYPSKQFTSWFIFSYRTISLWLYTTQIYSDIIIILISTMILWEYYNPKKFIKILTGQLTTKIPLFNIDIQCDTHWVVPLTFHYSFIRNALYHHSRFLNTPVSNIEHESNNVIFF